MRRLCFVAASVALVGCTPAEKQVAAQDGARIVAEFAACVAQHARDPGATALGVATACGVAEIPAAVALASDEIAASKHADAGAP